MANPKIRFKRSSIPGKKPSVGDLPLGEIAINTNDGEVYIARERAGLGTDIVRVGAGATVTNILYVTEDGNDNNTGKKLGDAKATIRGAVAAAVPGTVIKISAGTYVEDNPIVLPDNVSVVGDSLREVTVTPANQGDLFWVANGCYIAEMSFIGPANPNAAIVAFNPEVVGYIDQSPYVQNCTNFIAGTIGMRINGEDAIGPIKSMVLDSYTQINNAGVGISITNVGYAQLVSLFTICPDTAVFCGSGGGCDLTNSNSSFGNFGLVADGVSPLKYIGIVTQSAGSDSSSIVVDLSVPQYNVIDAVYDHITGVVTVTTDAPHGFSVGMGVTLAGLGFTCPSDGGVLTLNYPSGNKGYVFETRTVAPGRYVDASESITANRVEILDKSLAAIALNHPDFYFPGEDQTNSKSRFFDSYRLIQQNKQEIIDRSLAEIAFEYPDFYFPNDAPTNARSRFYDSYRLIQQNKQEIIDRSLAGIAIQHPDFYFPDWSRNRFKDAYNLLNANKDEIIDKSLATISLYHPDFYFPGDAQETDRSRYYDSYRLIIDNKQEIVDKSLAAIALDYDNNFYFPGDVETNARSRYFDAYRLIQKNKQEVIDRSLAQIAFDYDGNFYFPGDEETNERSRFFDSYRLIQENKQEIIDKSLASISIEYPDFYFPDDAQTNARSRFFDSYRLIQQNKQEVVDKSLASIALNYDGDFYFPGDSETNERSRFFDSYRLIQENKQEIIDKSIGAIAINYSSYPDFYFPGDTETNGRSRYYDAYRLIQLNRTQIVNSAWSATLLQYPGISATQTKCKRDLGYFIDAISADVLTGGNSYAQEFVLQYVENPGGNGLAGEEVQSIYAFNQARNLMRTAITNGLTVKDVGITTSAGASSNTDPNACADVRTNIDNLTAIITTAVADGDTASFAPRNPGYFAQAGIGSTTPGGQKCARDLGFLVDAISTDIFTGGNSYAAGFTLQYFDENGDPIANGLIGEEDPSIVGFEAAADYMRRAVTNQLNAKDVGISSGPSSYGGPGVAHTVFISGNAAACIDVQNAIDNLVGIVTVTIGAGDTSLLPAAGVDLNLGYFAQSGVGTTSSPGGFKCARDLGFLVDAVSTDVFTGGNSYAVGFSLQYFNNGSPIANGLIGEEAESIIAFEAASDYMRRAITNQLNAKDVGISSGKASYAGAGTSIAVLPSGNAAACIDVQNTIDNLVGIVTATVGSGSTASLPLNVNYGYFNHNTGVGGTVSSPGGFKCARDLGFFIDAISTDVFTGGNYYATGFALQYFENAAPIINGILGEEGPSIVAFDSAGDYMRRAVTNQLNAKDVGISSGTAEYGGVGDPIEVLLSGNAASCIDVQNTIDNLVGIVTVTVGAGDTSALPVEGVDLDLGYFSQSGVGTTSSPGGFKCARDLGFLVDAVSTDVFTGGNSYSAEFALQYFDGNGDPITNGLLGEEGPSLIAFEAASDYLRRAVTNRLNLKEVGISSGKASYAGAGTSIAVLPSGNAASCVDVQNTIDTLVGIVTAVIGSGDIDEIPANLNYGYFILNNDEFTKHTLNSVSYGSTVPGGQKCARDLGYLIDSLATDVFTGANAYSIEFALKYFDNVGSATTALLGEEAQSVISFGAVADYAKKAITNQLNRKDIGISSGTSYYGVAGDDQEVFISGNPLACIDVQDNIDSLIGIVTSSIGAGSTSGFPVVFTGFFNQSGLGTATSPDGFKCARDLGYLANAVAEDIYTGGNKNLVGFALSYFDNVGDPLVNGLVGETNESITAFIALSQFASAAVTNQLYAQDLTLTPDLVTGDNRSPESCADVTTSIDNLVGIATVTIGAGTTSSLPAVNAGYDERDDNIYRFFDGYRLIQQNRQEIIDKSIGEIAINYAEYPDFYFPGDSETNERSRYYDSYRLIQLNKEEIVGTAFTAAVNNPAFSAFDFAAVEDKCKRDIGFFIDAVSADVLTGGNNYSAEFVFQYVDNPGGNGLAGEETESIYTFVAARDLMYQAITNNLTTYTDLGITTSAGASSNTDPTACADVQTNIENLVGIVTAVIGAGNTSSITEITYGYFNESVGLGTTNTPGGFKCARDVGFFVDAVSTDVFIRGNKYSQEFSLQYFDNAGNPTYVSSEEDPTVYGLEGARDFMIKAVTNQLNRKDVGISSGFAEYGVGNTYIDVLPSGNAASCVDVQNNITSLTGIVTTVIGSASTSFLGSIEYNTGIFDSATGIGTTENPGGFKCARDIGFLIDAVSTDVFTGGNVYSRGFSLQYFDANGNPIRNGLLGETAESVTAFTYSNEYMKKAVSNQLYRKDLTLTFGPAEYGGAGEPIEYNASGNSATCIDVQNTIDTLINIVTTVIDDGDTDSLDSVGINSGYFFQIPGEFNQTVGFGTTAGDFVGLGTTSANAAYKCARDIGYFVDAVSTDVFVGGNTYSIGFAQQYFDVDGDPIAPGLDVERDESVTAFSAAREYMKKALTNQLYAKDLTLSYGPAVYGGAGGNIIYNRSGNSATCVDVQNTVDTLSGIVTSVIGIGTLTALDSVVRTSGSFLDNQGKCRRDIGYIVDAISRDLENFTNKNIIEATNYYFDAFGAPVENALVGEEAETVTAFRAAGEYSKLAINNQLNVKNFTLLPDYLTDSNNNPDSCSDVKDTIDTLVGILTDAIISGSATEVEEFSPSTLFSANVGAGPFPHTYVSGGTVSINAIRPFDGQVILVDRLYYTLGSIKVTNGGSGYTETPEITISAPTTDWGVPAQAIATVENGTIVSVEVVSSGRGFIIPPQVTIADSPTGDNARISPEMTPTYYTVSKASPISSGICTVTVDSQIPYEVGIGTEVYFYRQSRILASGQSFEYIGAGTDIRKALPQKGGVTIPENETVSLNGGLVVYTSTDQSGNFKIGDGLIINQNTGTISGTSYSKSLFSTLTPFILALGGE